MESRTDGKGPREPGPDHTQAHENPDLSMIMEEIVRTARKRVDGVDKEPPR